MNAYAITFAGSDDPFSLEERHYLDSGIHRDYVREARRLMGTAKEAGLKGRTIFNFNWLRSTIEYSDNPLVFAKRPYAWAFKPLSIYYTMLQIDQGDVVLYTDSNHYYTKYPSHAIRLAEHIGIYIRDHTPTVYQNGCWTHRDTFKRMNCDEPMYWSAPMKHADQLGICKNEFTMGFVEEWKNYTCDYLTSVANTEKNFPCFQDHRDDQSIISILTEKYGIPACPSTDAIHEGPLCGLDKEGE